MNSAKKNNIRVIVSSICVVLAFICGYLFALRQNFLTQEPRQKNYIDINTKKDSITIKNAPKNVYFRVNGEILQSGNIPLK